jgi:hypothetical protein
MIILPLIRNWLGSGHPGRSVAGNVIWIKPRDRDLDHAGQVWLRTRALDNTTRASPCFSLESRWLKRRIGRAFGLDRATGRDQHELREPSPFAL